MSKHPRFFMSRGCGVPIRMYRGTGKIEGPAVVHHRHCEGASATVAISTAAVGCAGMYINIENPGYTMLIGAIRSIHGAGDCHAPVGLAMTVEDGGWSRFAGSAVVGPNRTEERHRGRSLHCKSKMRKNPRFRTNSEETGVFPLKLFVPIRRAEASDWSGGLTRLPSSKIYQARVWPSGLPT